MFQCMNQKDFDMIAAVLKQASLQTLGRDRSILQDAAMQFECMEETLVEMFPQPTGENYLEQSPETGHFPHDA